MREVIDDFVESFPLAHPTAHFSAQQRADPLQRLCALWFVLGLQGLINFTQRIFTGGRHTPGEEGTATGVCPGVVSGTGLVDRCYSHLQIRSVY
jgi:hypothetical protein